MAGVVSTGRWSVFSENLASLEAVGLSLEGSQAWRLNGYRPLRAERDFSFEEVLPGPLALLPPRVLRSIQLVPFCEVVLWQPTLPTISVTHNHQVHLSRLARVATVGCGRAVHVSRSLWALPGIYCPPEGG